jgi:hypothetical protein
LVSPDSFYHLPDPLLGIVLTWGLRLSSCCTEWPWQRKHKLSRSYITKILPAFSIPSWQTRKKSEVTIKVKQSNHHVCECVCIGTSDTSTSTSINLVP